jgi:hypothetical protein
MAQGKWKLHKAWKEIHSSPGMAYDDSGVGINKAKKDKRIIKVPPKDNVVTKKGIYNDIGWGARDPRYEIETNIAPGQGKRKKLRKELFGSGSVYMFADGGAVCQHPTRMACGGKVKK